MKRGIIFFALLGLLVFVFAVHFAASSLCGTANIVSSCGDIKSKISCLSSSQDSGYWPCGWGAPYNCNPPCYSLDCGDCPGSVPTCGITPGMCDAVGCGMQTCHFGCCGYAYCNGDGHTGTQQTFSPFTCDAFAPATVDCSAICPGGTCDSSRTGSFFCGETHVVCDCNVGAKCSNKQCVADLSTNIAYCGVGSSDCADKHLDCRNQQCVPVDDTSQISTDQCSTNSDCTNKHLDCGGSDGNQCIIMPGPGSDRCSPNSLDCFFNSGGCVFGDTRSCTTEGFCPGRKTCLSGNWNLEDCIKTNSFCHIGCSSDDDCTGFSDPCLTGVCDLDNEICTYKNAGTSCDANGGQCDSNGNCVHPPQCTPGSPCITFTGIGQCDSNGTCVPVQCSPINDGAPCTLVGGGNGVCENGVCITPNPTPNVCPESQIIMKLTQQNISSGALWSETSANYGYDICYNQIFGINYTGTNPHNCTTGNSNSVVWLNLTKDSNASNTSSSGFNLPVCYGDLQCFTRTVCLPGESTVVSLSQLVNSLISAEGNDVYKICCRSVTKGAYWSDLNGNPINTVGLKSKVRLNVNVQGASISNINYTLWRQWGLGDFVSWFDKVVSQTSSNGFDEWRAGYNGTDYSDGNYYFTAVDNNGIEYYSKDNANYGILAVSDIEVNTPPAVDILTPIDKQVYFNDNINFTAQISDPDDNFNFTWYLGDSSTKQGSSLSMGNASFNYTYGQVGQKFITLNATDERGLSTSESISILVVNASAFTFADISSPGRGQSYLESVLFNGSLSYAINVTNISGVVGIVCLAGNCPSQTEGVTQLSIGGTPNWAGFSNLNFTWNIDGFKTVVRMGWNGSNFSQNFLIPRQHNAILNVFLDGAIPGFDSVIFSTSLRKPRCVASSTSASWIFNNGTGDFPLTPFYCYNSSGVDDLTGVQRTSCCPTGQLCDSSSGVCSSLTVVSTPVHIARCNDYNIANFGSIGVAEAACNIDNASVGIFSVDEIEGRPDFCGSNYITPNCTEQVTLCGCVWDSNIETCNSTFNATGIGSGCSNNGISKSCSYSATDIVDDCNNTETLTYHATASGTLVAFGLCEDKNVPGLCARSLMKLPFFNWINVICAVSILIAFYFFAKRKK